jgi:hypothetical protein
MCAPAKLDFHLFLAYAETKQNKYLHLSADGMKQIDAKKHTIYIYHVYPPGVLELGRTYTMDWEQFIGVGAGPVVGMHL